MIFTKAYAASAVAAPMAPYAFARRELRPADVLIEIAYCGICHSDIHQVRDGWGGSQFPMVPGHEITGIVTRTGSAVTKFRGGDRVGVGCFVDSCRQCTYCKRGDEQYCVEGQTSTYNALERNSNTRTMGGYSERIVVDQDYVLKIPDQLSLQHAAPLLCAGITLYSPLKHWRVHAGQRVLIVGLGGLGHMGVKLAHALGADVTVISQSNSKRAEALNMGARAYYSASDPDTFRELRASADLIINTVSADIDWNAYLSLLKVDGTMVVVGVPERNVPISPLTLINPRLSLSGSSIGGIRETQEMLDFCAQRGITPDIELTSITQLNEAYERILKSDVRYRFVIDMATLREASDTR